MALASGKNLYLRKPEPKPMGSEPNSTPSRKTYNLPCVIAQTLDVLEIAGRFSSSVT